MIVRRRMPHAGDTASVLSCGDEPGGVASVDDRTPRSCWTRAWTWRSRNGRLALTTVSPDVDLAEPVAAEEHAGVADDVTECCAVGDEVGGEPGEQLLEQLLAACEQGVDVGALVGRLVAACRHRAAASASRSMIVTSS